MDPTQAIIAPWMQLGIVGSVVIALGVVVVMQWRRINEVTAAHMADVKACGLRSEDLLTKKIESDNALTIALTLLKETLLKDRQK
jgi:hypothetical protein